MENDVKTALHPCERFLRLETEKKTAKKRKKISLNFINYRTSSSVV